jgi:hypothetical protein
MQLRCRPRGRISELAKLRSRTENTSSLKPFTSNVGQAEQLINLAEQKNLKIMVDYTFLFTGAVRKIKQLLQEGSLGKLYYYDSTRGKPGTVPT